MTSETGMRSTIDDMTRQHRELRLLALITGAATTALLATWVTGFVKGPLPAVGAVLTGMAAVCAWICSDVCRKATTLLRDRDRKEEGIPRP